MSDIHQIVILKKGNKIHTSISTMPTKEVYAMLYGAIKSVAKNAGQTVKSTLDILADLDNFVQTSGQE